MLAFFRHGFASHLFRENYNIRTIREMPGYGDIEAIMICTMP